MRVSSKLKKGVLLTLIVLVVAGVVLVATKKTGGIMHLSSHHEGMIDFTESKGEVLKLAHWKTPEGVRVYFTEAHNLPMVDIELVFDAGSTRDGTSGGLAYLTNGMLMEGTQTQSADDIAQRFESVGAHVSTQVEREMAVVHLRSLVASEYLDPAVETLAEILKAPAFKQDSFARNRENTLTVLKSQMQSPARVATRALYSALYAKQAYANWVQGDAASIKALNTQALTNFYKKYYVRNNVVVAVVGALTPEQVNQLVRKITAGLPDGQKAPALPEITALTQPITQTIDFPSSQTHVMMAGLGMKYSDPDYFALVVGNHILGGSGSVSRIFHDVRAAQGLAYDASSYFIPMGQKGPYLLGLQTENSTAEKAIHTLKQTLVTFVQSGPTEEELALAKKNIVGGFALRFDSNEGILNHLSVIGFYGLPLDFYNKYPEQVQAMTNKQILEAYQRRVDPEKMVMILVGSHAKTNG